jgi:hypothetical protein
MSSVLIVVGLLGLVAAVVGYERLLASAAPGERVERGGAGGLAREPILLWLLVVMLSMSVLLVGVGVAPNGVTLVGSVVVAMLASEVGRWWHNRELRSPDGPPTTPEA